MVSSSVQYSEDSDSHLIEYFFPSTSRGNEYYTCSILFINSSRSSLLFIEGVNLALMLLALRDFLKN